MAPVAPSRALIFLLILFGVIPLLWPGDAPWINDEPILIAMAQVAKSTGELPGRGLSGSKGVVYGPLPVWIYTGMLHLTGNDLVNLVLFRAALVTLLTALAIFWIARMIPALNPPVGALALLSPYIWVYSRQLWDNTFLIPLSALTLAAYLSFSARPRPSILTCTLLLAVGMVLTHLMSAGLLIPLAIHFFWFHHAWIRRRPALLLALIGLAAALLWPYLREWTPVGSDRGNLSPAPGWIFPLFGGQFFSAFGIEYFFGSEWRHSELLDLPKWIWAPALITYLALPAAWIGMGLAAVKVFGVFRGSSKPDALFHAGLIALLSLIAQSALCGLMRSYGHPHYFNATWMIFWLFVWISLSRLASHPGWRFVGSLYGLCLAAVLTFLIVTIHHSKGNQSIHYGPTLSHQIDIARQLNAHHPNSPITSNSKHYALFPHALGVLRAVYGWHGADTAPITRLRIEQRKGGRIEVIAE